MRPDLVDIILIMLTAFSGIAGLLLSNNLLNTKFTIPVVILGSLSLSAEAVWIAFGKRAKRAKQAQEILDQSLNTLLSLLKENSDCQLRANIMVPKGICVKKLHMKYMSSNMKDAEDRDICLEKWEACGGTVWGANKPLAAKLYLHSSEPGMPQWVLRPEIEYKTKDLKILVSFPLRNPKKPSKVIGVLSVDSKDLASSFLLDDQTIDKLKAFASFAEEVLDNLGQI